MTQHKQVSDETASVIDEEIRRIIDSNYDRSKKILEANKDKLHAMADALMKYETINEIQIKDIMEGRDPQPPEDWDDSAENQNSSGKNSVSSKSDENPGKIGDPAQEH